MIFLFRFLFGYVDFVFLGGFSESFLNNCFKQGLAIRDVKKYSNALTAQCSVKTYKKLRKIARESGGKTKITKKVGLGFILPKAKYRYGFFAGFVLFVLIICFLNSFVWQIQVTGNDTIGEATIISFLENNSLRSGVMWSSVDREKLKWKMMSEFDEIAWVHINRIGAKAVVEISEGTPAEKEYDENALKGIDAVQIHLEAIALRQQNNIKLTDLKSYKRLIFFTAKIPLYLSREQGNISSTSTKYITLFDKSLPIGIEDTQEKFFKAEPITLSNDELKALAKRKLKNLEKQELEQYRIVNKSVVIDIDSDKAIAKGNYIVTQK